MNMYVKQIELSEEQKALYDLMESTRKNLFITGKAGTGKSYLLKYFKEHTKKNVLYTAPTGIAAINIGAVTIHSAFGGGKDSSNLKDGAKFFRLFDDKINILRNLEVLVIDEISMVRVDILEQIDKILKFYNCTDKPFGGKQVIVFGDIFQLPPVVKTREEQNCFSDKYGDVYFFNSNAYYNGNFEIKELRKIYRQTNRTFIDILNKVREGFLPKEYEDILNQRYVTKAPEGIIQLVTRNDIREEINKKNLEKINGKEYCYNAEIFYNPNIKYKREVNPKDYMCDFELKLKVGAHIMMVANDKDKRWVNGTFGTISELGNDYIKVLIDDNEYTVEKYEFIKYKCYYKKNEKKLIYIEENCVKQFPVILAYAVTIHKSQGMTYQEVVCDLDGCFASGQAYVALSRCVSLDTLYLVHKVYQKDVFTNSTIMKFYNEEIKMAG